MGSELQNGPNYLQYERDSSWPINREMLSGHDAIPNEEKIINVFSINTGFMTDLCEIIRGIAETHRKILHVLRIIARLVGANKLKAIVSEPSPEGIAIARQLLEVVYGQDTAIEVERGKLVGLDPRLSKGRFVTRGRFGKGIANVLGIAELPILLPDSHLAYLIMVNAHEESHNEAKSTLARSRSQAWIVRGYNLAKKVCQECSRCKLFHKRKAEQKLGYLPPERFELGLPPFTNISLDLAAPIKVLDMVKKRCSMKAWQVIFCCLNTGAVHMELLHTYGADAFLTRWKVFTSIRGTPKYVVSDKGSRLQAASIHVD